MPYAEGFATCALFVDDLWSLSHLLHRNRILVIKILKKTAECITNREYKFDGALAEDNNFGAHETPHTNDENTKRSQKNVIQVYEVKHEIKFTFAILPKSNGARWKHFSWNAERKIREWKVPW